MMRGKRLLFSACLSKCLLNGTKWLFFTHYTTRLPGRLHSDWLVQPELIRKCKVFRR